MGGGNGSHCTLPPCEPRSPGPWSNKLPGAEYDIGEKGLVLQAIEIGDKYDQPYHFQVDARIDCPLSSRNVVREVRAKQKWGLKDVRKGKVIHGVFVAVVDKSGCDRAATFARLTSGNFRAETEGLLVAAQDGVLHTAAYRHSVLKDGCNPTCRECRSANETIGHILSACPIYLWNLYRCRHDTILNILVVVA